MAFRPKGTDKARKEMRVKIKNTSKELMTDKEFETMRIEAIKSIKWYNKLKKKTKKAVS